MVDLKQMIKDHEGFSNYPYLCSQNHKTIGWGWNLDANPLPKDIQAYLDGNGLITPAHAERLLDISIGNAIASCKRLFPRFDYFDETRKAALTDFLFNIGIGTAKKFIHAIAAINTGRWEEAAKEMRDSDWFRQVGKRAVAITAMIESDGDA